MVSLKTSDPSTSDTGTGPGGPASLFAEASRYIPGGAGSSARTVKFGWKPYPPFMAEGRGRGCATWTATSTSTTCSAWAR